MKALLTICLLLLPTMVVAQSPELNLKVSAPEADLIWKGLRKMPVEEVEQLMNKLRQQVMEQTTTKPAEQVKEPEKAK